MTTFVKAQTDIEKSPTPTKVSNKAFLLLTPMFISSFLDSIFGGVIQ